MISYYLKLKKKIPFKYTVLSGLPALVYGAFYLANVLINGIGKWPDTNDWYGFLNWGYPVGIVIFAAIVLMDFGMAVLLRGLNILINRGAQNDTRQQNTLWTYP